MIERQVVVGLTDPNRLIADHNRLFIIKYKAMQKPTCILCGKQIVGRTDKKYCSITCKNTFNYKRRSKTKSATQAIDTILHKNREILNVIMGTKRKQMQVVKTELIQMGFQSEYITGFYTNSRGKLYHYVYDFAWMEFTGNKILVYKK